MYNKPWLYGWKMLTYILTAAMKPKENKLEMNTNEKKKTNLDMVYTVWLMSIRNSHKRRICSLNEKEIQQKPGGKKKR